MRQHIFAIACICSAAVFVAAIPLPANNQELDVLQIPLSNGKEIDVLTLGAKDQEQLIADRNKRTVGLLRELFPDITKQIDAIVNRIIAQVIRVAGPSLLPALLGNNRPTTPRSSFDADFDDDDEDGDDSNSVLNTNNVAGDNDRGSSEGAGVRVSVDLPTFAPDTTTAVLPAAENTVSASTATSATATPTTPTATATSATATTPTTTSTITTTTTTTSSTTVLPTTSTPSTTLNSILVIPITPATTITRKDLQAVTKSLSSTPINTETSSSTTTSLNTSAATVVATVAPTVPFANVTTQDLLNLPQLPAPVAVDVDESQLVALIDNNGASDTQIDLSAINKQLEETIRVARQVKEAEAAAAAISTLNQPQQQQTQGLSIPQQLPIPKSNPNEPIQLSFNNEISLTTSNDNTAKAVSNDLSQSDSKSPAIDELSLDSNEDTADLDDRNKRFLSFGGAGIAGGSSGGSNGGGGAGGAGAGGSGNFLFDIVRLFSGSVQTQAGDESANSANSVSGSSDTDSDSDANRATDGYTEGIPGPVTRLVVLANRGLANLIQDLILRIAATSEKFVNFKAKLITALI